MKSRNHKHDEWVRKYILRMPPYSICVKGLLLCILYCSIGIPICGAAEGEPAEPSESSLPDMTLEELMNLEITVNSATRKPQKAFETPSAVYIITSEDIRRSGAENIPDILRMVPGMHIARINANKWAVTARGFNGRFTSKMLVLVDGRSVYSPLFSGVYWDTQDTLIEDIDRIEIIRGPGGSLWGANAVNGIINIITKHTMETTGVLVSAGMGSEERGSIGFRYGGVLSDKSYYRMYAKYFNIDEAVDSEANPSGDHWQAFRAGFRTDSNISDRDSLTLHGDFFKGEAVEILDLPQLAPPFSTSVQADSQMTGGSMAAHWNRYYSPVSDLQLQIFYDRAQRDNIRLNEGRDTFDVDFQHRIAWKQRHEIVWGLGYRLTHATADNTFFFSFYPNSRIDHLYSGFIQDSIALADKKVIFTAGSKVERNDYTGIELQPSANLVWMPDKKNTFWTSIYRAVRTPNRIENDTRHNPLVIPGNPPVVLSIFGNGDIEHEEVIAFEAGYRTRQTQNLNFDISYFYNYYDELRTFEPGNSYVEDTPLPAHRVRPITIENRMHGQTYGIEIAADYKILDGWSLEAAYTYLHMDLTPDADSRDTQSEAEESQNPRNQFFVKSAMDLNKNLELDLGLRFVDNLPALNLDSYTTLDIRLGYKINQNWELSVAGRDLLQPRHAEWGVDRDNHSPSQVQRSFYGKIAWRF